MNFRDLLVYLDGSDRTEITMEVAVEVARRHKARLSGLHVVGFLLPAEIGFDLCGTSLPLSPNRNLDIVREAARVAACRAESVFVEQSRRAGLAGDWCMAEGMVAYTAGQHARGFDMAIVGQIDPAHPPLGTRKHVPEALFLESGCPVLIIPCVGQISGIAHKVLIGWDGSREAARAVNDAMPFLKEAASVMVVTLCNETDDASNASADPATMISHLHQHGVHATGSRRKLRHESITDALLACTAEAGADLLVMGGYGHSRIREVVLGGTTREVLRHMAVPVLISH